MLFALGAHRAPRPVEAERPLQCSKRIPLHRHRAVHSPQFEQIIPAVSRVQEAHSALNDCEQVLHLEAPHLHSSRLERPEFFWPPAFEGEVQ